jgi:hypothetical protein
VPATSKFRPIVERIVHHAIKPSESMMTLPPLLGVERGV